MDHDHGNRRRGLPLSELDPALTEKSRKVIGGAIEVHKALGPGFSREIYMNALKIELEAAGLEYEMDAEFEVVYKDNDLGGVSIDVFVEERFAVEILAPRRYMYIRKDTRIIAPPLERANLWEHT